MLLLVKWSFLLQQDCFYFFHIVKHVILCIFLKEKNHFQHPYFRSSGESIEVCVWGLSRRDLSIVTPAGLWETFFYSIMSVLTPALISQFAVVWSRYYQAFGLLPPPVFCCCSTSVCVFIGFSPTAAFICSFVWETFWIKFSFNQPILVAIL